MQSDQFIQSLEKATHQFIAKAEELKTQNRQRLTWRAHETSWSVLECLEHLNLYGDFYLPHLQRKISQSVTTPDAEFTSGWLGGYFAKSMLPKTKLNKMKTFNDKNPIHANLDSSVIDRFIQQQHTLLTLLAQAKRVSLNKVRIPISIAPFIKLKLGDTFNFYINHIIRHMQQIERIETDMINSDLTAQSNV